MDDFFATVGAIIALLSTQAGRYMILGFLILVALATLRFCPADSLVDVMGLWGTLFALGSFIGSLVKYFVQEKVGEATYLLLLAAILGRLSAEWWVPGQRRNNEPEIRKCNQNE